MLKHETDHLDRLIGGLNDLGWFDHKAGCAVRIEYTTEHPAGERPVQRKKEEIVDDDSVHRSIAGHIRRGQPKQSILTSQRTRGVHDMLVARLSEEDSMRETHRQSDTHWM